MEKVKARGFGPPSLRGERGGARTTWKRAADRRARPAAPRRSGGGWTVDFDAVLGASGCMFSAGGARRWARAARGARRRASARRIGEPTAPTRKRRRAWPRTGLGRAVGGAGTP